MEITLGPFYTCFLATFFLAIYLHIIIQHSSVFREWMIKFSIIGVLLILIRMLIPINFPFTYTIYSYQFLPRLTEFTNYELFGTTFQVSDVMYLAWFFIAIILLIKLIIQYWKMKQYLSLFFIEKDGENQYLYNLLYKYCKREIEISIVPETISPAITGLWKPILILPDVTCFSNRELEYVFMHEIEHYNKKHLWFGLIMEIFCRIHWWNPFVQYVKKEFSLFLELSNDFLLIQSVPDFNVAEYADLIVKTSRKIYDSKNIVPISSINFVIDKKDILKTRVQFILDKQVSNHVRRWQTLICVGIVSISVLLSIFVVPEARFPDNPEEQGGAVEITEENAYILITDTGYSIYVYGKLWGNIDYIPEDFKNLPIYNEGDVIDEK